MKRQTLFLAVLVMIASSPAFAAESPQTPTFSWATAAAMNLTGGSGFVTLKSLSEKSPSRTICAIPSSSLLNAIEVAMAKEPQKIGEHAGTCKGVFQSMNKEYNGSQTGDSTLPGGPANGAFGRQAH